MDAALSERFGRTFAAGTVLFREGDRGKEMYVIQTGSVQLTRLVRGREVHLTTLPPGEFFGEMSIVNNTPRSATATVIEESFMLVIDGRTFEAMIRGNAEIAMRLIKKLAGRLAAANSQVEVLLLADINHRIVHHLRGLAETRGVQDGVGVRVDASIEDIAEVVDHTVADTAACIQRLEKAHLIHKELGSIHIAEVGKLDEFLEFLQLKRQMT
jgi:CRP-like cAMP-binding protein